MSRNPVDAIDRTMITAEGQEDTSAYSRRCFRLAKIALELGRAMSDCGAEIYRIEDTVTRFLRASQVEEVEVFAVITFLSINFTDKNGHTYNRSARLRGRDPNLDRLDRLNGLARRYSEEPCDLEAFERELKSIADCPVYNFWFKAAAGGFAAWAFAIMLGCQAAVALWSIPVTLLMYLVIRPLIKFRANKIFVNLVGSAAIMLVALLLQSFGFMDTVQTGAVTIGALMNLVPGLTMTNGIRDLISSDYVAGLSNLCEALITAGCLALGSGAVLALWRLFV